MNLLVLLLLSYVPSPASLSSNEKDLIVLNHTKSADWSYTQLVVINNGEIEHVEWQPTFRNGGESRWLTKSQAYDLYIVTVVCSSGEVKAWQSKRFVEFRTQNNDWMKQFQPGEK